MDAERSDYQHLLTLHAERLGDLVDKVRTARFATSRLDLEDAERDLRNAETHIESAWQAVEKAVDSSRKDRADDR